MLKFGKIALFCMLLTTPLFSSAQNTTATSIQFATKTIATLPAAAANKNRVFLVTDSVTSDDCTAGAGTLRSLCFSTGTIYVSLSGLGVVHLINDETINGNKTFLDTIIAPGINGNGIGPFGLISTDQTATPPGVPDLGNTWIYTLNGGICSLDPTAVQNCTNDPINVFGGCATFSSVTGEFTQYGCLPLVNSGVGSEIYNTASATQTGTFSVPITLVAATPSVVTWYRISFYAEQVALGVGCTGNTLVQVQVGYNGPNASAVSNFPVDTCAVIGVGAAGKPLNCGGGALGQAAGSLVFPTKPGTAITFNGVYTAGAGCTGNPSYTVTPIFEQL